IWTGCDLQKDRWVLESNATLTGANLEWIVRLLCERAENPDECVKKTLNSLDVLLVDIPPGSNETLIGLGPSIMDCQRITDVKQARMIFPQPALPQIVPLNSATLIHAVLENIAYAARGNLEQLGAHKEFSCIKTIGGMTQSKIWPTLLANIIGKQVHTPMQPEGSLIGAVICAAKGVGHYPSLSAAAKNIVKWKPTSEPDDRATLYESYYSKWKRMWCEGE
ncbi:MAG: hypothetical protein IH631_08405, partial [Candidatus Thorarchaeota archaeon]|nr:hypothetical protein [Candidatus Thorarchaeota archaeon]